jgi:hypothetical protein
MIKTVLVYTLFDWCIDILFGSVDHVFNIADNIHNLKIGDNLCEIAYSVDTNNVGFLVSITCVMRNVTVVSVCSEFINAKGSFSCITRWKDEKHAEEHYLLEKRKFKSISEWSIKLYGCCVICSYDGQFECNLPIKSIQYFIRK